MPELGTLSQGSLEAIVAWRTDSTTVFFAALENACGLELRRRSERLAGPTPSLRVLLSELQPNELLEASRDSWAASQKASAQGSEPLATFFFRLACDLAKDYASATGDIGPVVELRNAIGTLVAGLCGGTAV